ncbi:fucolectin-6-like [Liolophura sinensis]|uniref:fucolectin-6-like n=1 Tax=Liolophura sinensis TaxID=3198878 RepID=UPI003158914D
MAAFIAWILIISSILPGNVALHRPTAQSSNYSNTLYLSTAAVDGVTGHTLETPCTRTAEDGNSDPFWTVTLDQPYWIYRFTIYNRHENCEKQEACGARLNGFTVSVGDSSGAYTTCYQDSTTSTDGPGDVIKETCSSPVLGNTVKISLSSDKILTLCEVLIYGKYLL